MGASPGRLRGALAVGGLPPMAVLGGLVRTREGWREGHVVKELSRVPGKGRLRARHGLRPASVPLRRPGDALRRPGWAPRSGARELSCRRMGGLKDSAFGGAVASVGVDLEGEARARDCGPAACEGRPEIGDSGGS